MVEAIEKQVARPQVLGNICRASGFVVRPRGCHISTVRVRVGESHTSVAEGHGVVVRRGEKQPEANGRSAGDELDSAACDGESSTKDLAKNNFPKLVGLWNGAIVPAREEVIEPDTHRFEKIRGTLFSRHIDPGQNIHSHF